MSQKPYDYLIVGAGFFGSICAHELQKRGKKVLVIEKRNHIGGNCYTENRDGINIHYYGAHIFHTSNKTVWDWINQFAEFNHFTNRVVANYKGKLFALPFNMWTFHQLWGVITPDEVKKKIEEQGSYIQNPQNLEEQAIHLVGKDVYETLIKGYTAKQWMKDPKELPKEIIKRLPVRYTFDTNYFNDPYQGIPKGGYTQIFEKLLEGIEVQLGVDFLASKTEWLDKADKVIYTGPIDAYFNYEFGPLEYKSVTLDLQKKDTDNFQGNAVVNYTEQEIPYTRIIEHKHFEFGTTDSTWISYEYPTPYEAQKTEPYYPVNDATNNALFQKYKEKAAEFPNVIFGGRLAEYKYYDMHQIIERALDFLANH
ncbi:UDP-galactopyranose mutase [Sandaracinomonas limnophila]|uniref:UDP-galactopyranose mutase n=1 Tax=Sandaracinomonas limnophila TaxID=1862386 RepID=A0A437PP65_9BACT|nr:UDP-galactopyranose mutase [Sandaracinomonas limnophila]RVU24057.1 UDP-galactopyranose mutase [Sandaracinomonas limnophila]